MVVADPSIPESRDVTCDSLSAWLAAKLNGSTLIPIKSFAIGEHQRGIAEPVQRGWVDPRFPMFTVGAHF